MTYFQQWYSGSGNHRAIRQFSKRFTQVFVEHAVFSFLFLSTSRSHSLRSSSNCRRGLLASSSPTTSKTEDLSSFASELVLATSLDPNFDPFRENLYRENYQPYVSLSRDTGKRGRMEERNTGTME